MGDGYSYTVFFQCPGLDGEQRKRIQNYFNIRRKSGGGDCGSVTKINDNLYSISFKEREAQQRVLERSEHTLEFGNGPLVLTVRSCPGPHIPVTPSNSVSPKLDLTASSQQSLLGASLIPSGEEYELQCDTYLLRYLNECPKAWNDLQRKLTTVACTAQIHPEGGRVLVRSLAQPGAANVDTTWKSKVDKIFNDYLCHYEVDPHKVKALFQSCSSDQTTDEVKVYSEDGMAVVVGKRSLVNIRLMDLEGSTVKRQGSRLREKQTSVRRLGEGKLRILWKDINHSLERDFPGVKVSQGDPGQLVLEGAMEDISEAIDVITDKENLVLEKAFTNMSPHFMAFLRKVYGGPGVLCDFLGVGDEVAIELRDTDIRFFSLYADKVDATKRKIQEHFKEVKLDVPNCSAVLSELRAKLNSKTTELNQGKCRAQFVFISDSTVCLLGHIKEVEELSETVTQLILDHSSIEGKVHLPFPVLAQELPEFLQLHGFDYSGITFHPLTSSSESMVVLEGPSNKVTEVRNRLGPFLDSLVQSSVTIDLPGTVRYFESLSGRENMLSIAHSQKCLIKLQEQHHPTRYNRPILNNGCSTAASYSLCDGLQVLVCQGDITKQDADVLVNAANEDLDHCGGVAAALSKAGGPEVQKESKVLVKQNGKIPTGNVVVTTGGNLKCKKLLHAVGPVGGEAGGRERFLLEKTINSALNLAEIMEFKSIAMPCISSGIFGVPVTVCSEAIVTAVKEFGSHGGRSLSKIILIDNREEVVRAMQEACDRLLQGINTGNRTPSGLGFQMGAAAQYIGRETTARAPEDGVHVEIIQGTIETQQVDVLVSPMAGHDPLSTRVGNALSRMAGPLLTTNFHKEAGGAIVPGDIVMVQGLPVLQSKAVIFISLAVWDNNQRGTAVQVLRQSIRKVLTSCEIRGFTSVAFPVLGTGAVLRFPHSMVAKAALEEVKVFEQNRASRSSFLVRIVIHPSDKESGKAFQCVQEILHLRGFTNDTNPNQASFYRHVSTHIDEVTAMLGGIRLQMVQGDIINEATDAIVNTTDFFNFSGVSRAILTAAGPTVQAELAQVGIPPDQMCTTGPGLLRCREIIHASFHCNPQVIRKNCKKILKHCESKGYRSVAFPAINTGLAGVDSAKACNAMLDGMASAIRDLKPNSLSLIHIVILQQRVFQAFKSELENRFGLIGPSLSLKEKAKQKLKKWQEKYSQTSRSSALEDRTMISSKPQPAVINVISCGTDIIETIKRDLKGIMQKQLTERELDVHDFSKLDSMELEAVLAKVKVLGISLEHRRHQSSGSANDNRAQSGSKEEVCVLKGLKEDVLSVTELVNKAVKKALHEDLQEKKEALLALTVQWSILDVNGVWQELSLHVNYMMEVAHLNKDVFVDIMAPDGMMVKVNLKKDEATDVVTGLTYKMKRIETEATLELPSEWEPMHEEVFKKVKLQPNSPEYRDVARGFLTTANYNIQKIERVQNLYLWHAYSVCRQRILNKNGSAELGEKRLYHGTSAESCNCIERDRFDRSYAGEHAALYGKGVYFAVDAQYSARLFSPPDKSGLKRLYVARVLTGRYTVGSADMRAPPPRGTDPTNSFDSLVDNRQPPSMFVIFHDDQAYPEYLITFQ